MKHKSTMLRTAGLTASRINALAKTCDLSQNKVAGYLLAVALDSLDHPGKATAFHEELAGNLNTRARKIAIKREAARAIEALNKPTSR